ncbi:hypothetical protein G9A89_003613 [Geosiphon pyriformis]|nr:hypothetical protein G9A89_003613 [Geosiphon pyriformis]
MSETFANREASQLSLDYLRSLTNVEVIQDCLRVLDLEENQVDVDLDVLLERRGELEAKLEKMEALRPQLSSLSSQATDLMNILNGTSIVAERISAQVRQLDLEQSRVQETITEVENVQKLKLCINGIHSAMQIKDYEAAAGYIHRTMALDPSILEGEFAENAVPSSEYPDIPKKTLSDAKDTLFVIFSKEFDSAVLIRDENNISRFFRLFPLIGKEKEGLDKYSNFVCGIIGGKSQENLAKTAIGANFYAETLTKLFENIALIIDQHHPVVETHYGPGKIIRVIERIQDECDKQSRIILNTFSDEKQLQRKVADIHSYNNTPRRTINPLRSVQSKEYSGQFNSKKFKAMKDSGTDMSIEEMDDFKTIGLLSKSGLSKQIKMLIHDYILIEEYFLRRAIEQAMEMDRNEDGNSTSSCVDDVFYILKRSLSRALSTSNIDCISTMINLIHQSLENEFIKVIQKRLMSSFASNDNKDAKVSYMILLNNLDVSCDYIERLTSELQNDANKILAPLSAEEDYNIKVQKSISWLSESAISKFKQILNSGVEQLFIQLVKPRIRPILQEAYKGIKYVLDEDEYHEQDSNDNFAKRFVSGFDSLIHIYKVTFTQNNYNQLMIHLLDSLLNMWEKTVLATKFNQLGALRFDKDLRSVNSYFSAKIQWSFRDKFTRLNQISTLLNLESLLEIYDYWGTGSKSSSPITWRLTVTEARKVLSLRIEFKAEEVANMKL